MSKAAEAVYVRWYDGGVLHTTAIIVDYEQYDRYLNRQFPIKTITTDNENGDLYWLDKDDFIHRDDGLPSIVGKVILGKKEHTENYFVHGKLHRIDGPARYYPPIIEYHLEGVRYNTKDWEEKRQDYFLKSVYFLREKIKTLQKLTEIPEIWDKVYYTHKKKFISLMNKI